MQDQDKARAFDQLVVMLNKGAILQMEKGIDRQYLVTVSGEEGFMDSQLSKAIDQASKFKFTPLSGSFE